MDLDLSYQKVNTSQSSTDIESKKLSFSEVSQQNSFFNNDAIKILNDIENRKFKKLGNCFVKQINIFRFKKTIVIGPNWIFFIIGVLMFFGFDMFILYNFYNQLSSVLLFFNILILSLQLGFYTWCFISDPGIIFNKKANFSDDSTINCSTCYSTDKDRAIHCDDCGLCVSEYDHHCVWIGKCVGKKNYVIFYLFVVNTIVYFVVIIFLSGVINFNKKTNQFFQLIQFNHLVQQIQIFSKHFYVQQIKLFVMENYQEIAIINDEPRFGDITIMLNKNQPQLKAMKKNKKCKDQYEFYQQVKEIEIRKQIKHPNIMMMLGCEINKEKRMTSIFYEFPEKQVRIKKISKDQIMHFFRDILQGLIYLNSKKMIHGDLRPKYFFFDTENQIYKISDRLSSADPPLQTQMRNVYSFKPLYITNLLFNDLINKKKRVKLRPIKNEIFALGIITLQNFLSESEIQKFYDYDKRRFRQDLFEDQMNYLIEEEPDFYLKQFLEYLYKDVLVMDDSSINKQTLLQKIQILIEDKNQISEMYNSPNFKIKSNSNQNEGIKFSISSKDYSQNRLDFSPFETSKQFLQTATFDNSSNQNINFNRSNQNHINKIKYLQINITLQNSKLNQSKVQQLNTNLILCESEQYSNNNIQIPQIKTNIQQSKQQKPLEEQFKILGINFYSNSSQQLQQELQVEDSNLEKFQDFMFTFEKQKNTPKKKRQSLKLKEFLKKSPIFSERQIKKQITKNPPQKQIVRSFSYAKLQKQNNQNTKKKLTRNQSQMLYKCVLQKKQKEMLPKNMKQSTLLDNIAQMNLFMKRKKDSNIENKQIQLRDKLIKEPQPNKIDKCNEDLPFQIILNDINLKIELKEFNLIEIFKNKTLNKRKKSQQIIRLQRQQTLEYDEDIYNSRRQNQYSSNNSNTNKSILQDIDSILNKKNLDLLYKHMKIILIETINLM